MLSDISKLRQDIVRREQELKECKNRLSSIEANCKHDFASPEYTPQKFHESEVDWSRPPDKHGVHLDYYTRSVERSKPAYTRTCRLCGKTETTTKTQQKIENFPDFS